MRMGRRIFCGDSLVDGRPWTQGEPGAPGLDGQGIASVALEDNELVVTLTDGESRNWAMWWDPKVRPAPMVLGSRALCFRAGNPGDLEYGDHQPG